MGVKPTVISRRDAASSAVAVAAALTTPVRASARCESAGLATAFQARRPYDRSDVSFTYVKKGTRITMNPHVSVITLGVRDLSRARQFYNEGLGWPIQQEQDEWVCFSLGNGSSALALYPWDALADDAGVAADGNGFRGVTFAYNVRSEDRVDAVLAEAERAGGAIVRPARRASWGGYSGYFADPDGYLWEVATGATQLPFSE
jgi:catechol 2,3-dioxygenase-like lactoylglutathione lyase family enzyme